VHVSRILAQAGGRRVAARRPRSLTASGSTNNDPILICGLFLLAGPATSPLGEPFRASRGPRPLAGQPGRVAISRRSNALSDRCATKHGRPRSPPVPANVLVRQPERGPQRGAGPTDFVADQRCIRAGRSLRRERAFLLVRGRMVGLGGVEPPTSSLSAIEGSPLCNPAFLQVVRDRRGRSNALFERVAEGRLRSARRFSRRARTLPVTRQSSLSRCRLTCTEPPSA
jgi:hypothetical protein